MDKNLNLNSMLVTKSHIQKGKSLAHKAHPFCQTRGNCCLVWWHDGIFLENHKADMYGRRPRPNKPHRRSKTTPFCIYEKLHRRLAGRSGAFNAASRVCRKCSEVRTNTQYQPLDSRWKVLFFANGIGVQYLAAQFPHTKAGRARIFFPFRLPGDPDAQGLMQIPDTPQGARPQNGGEALSH